MGLNNDWRQVRVRVDVAERLGVLAMELTEKRDADLVRNLLSPGAQDVSLSDAIRYLLYQHDSEKVRKNSYNQARKRKVKPVHSETAK